MGINRRPHKHGKFNEEFLRLEKSVSFENAWNKCEKGDIHKEYVKLWDINSNIIDRDMLQMTKVRSYLTGKMVQEFKHDREVSTCFVEVVEQEDQGTPAATVILSSAQHSLSVTDELIPQGSSCYVELECVTGDHDTKTSRLERLDVKKVYENKGDTDFRLFTCEIHDLDLITNLSRLVDIHYQLGSKLEKRYADLKDTERQVIIVSYPHGYEKLVSFGKVLEKEVLKEVRDNQDFCEYSYSAKTCPGSSGASVYVQGKWKEGFGFWFGHPYVHQGAYEDLVGRSSGGVEAT